MKSMKITNIINTICSFLKVIFFKKQKTINHQFSSTEFENSKRNIDEELKKIILNTKSDSGTIYLPYPTTNNPSSLKIISILPKNEHTKKLYLQDIPLSSIVGQTYLQKEMLSISNANDNENFYAISDIISGYKTMSLVSIPIFYKKEIIAIIQLFKNSKNVVKSSQISTKYLSHEINSFINTSIWKSFLNIQEKYQYETIMFCDLTSSTLLFKELNINTVFEYIDLYFEELSDIALSHGATIDKYMGDGILFRFIKTEPLEILHASEKMIKKFEEIKVNWEHESYLFNTLFVRISLAYGPIIERIIGHSQYKSVGIFGQAINISIGLSNIAPKNKNIIILNHSIYNKLKGKNKFKTLEINNTGKASYYEPKSYIIELHN